MVGSCDVGHCMRFRARVLQVKRRLYRRKRILNRSSLIRAEYARNGTMDAAKQPTSMPIEVAHLRILCQRENTSL